MANNIGVASNNNCNLHWLQFSLPSYPDEGFALLELICTDTPLKSSDFHQSRNRMHGLTSYRTRHDFQGITVLSDHFSHSGIMVLLTGTACDTIAPNLVAIDRCISAHSGKVSRIDVAIDDFKGLLNIGMINQARLNNTVITRFQKARAIDESDLKAGKSTSPTVIFGSKHSDLQVRFYDRATKEGLDYHWVRCELQLRNNHAKAFLQEIAAGGSLAAIAMGVLQDKLSFRVPNGSNRKKWTEICSWWSEFLQNTAKLSLGTCKHRPESSMQKKLIWVERTVAPTLADIRNVYGIEKIIALCDKGEVRLGSRSSQRRLDNHI